MPDISCYSLPRRRRRDETLVMEEFASVLENWHHRLDVLTHRRTELQDHFTDQGGDLKAFFSVFDNSREARDCDDLEDADTIESPGVVKRAPDFVCPLRDIDLPPLPLKVSQMFLLHV